MASTASPLLTVDRMSRSFAAGTSRFTLLVEHMRIEPNTALAVTGPSGCGKSTLLGLLALAIRPDSAAAFTVGGDDLMAMWQRGDERGLARRRGTWIGYVPQTGGLLPYLSVGKNILLTQRIAGRADAAYVAQLATDLNIEDTLNRRPAQLSVGQRQRVAVARALAHRPSLVLADEPTASVHPAQADAILGLLRDAARRANAALVVSTHDEARARSCGLVVVACQPDASATRTIFQYAPDAAWA